jgi:hypothetical protein
MLKCMLGMQPRLHLRLLLLLLLSLLLLVILSLHVCQGFADCGTLCSACTGGSMQSC